MSLPKYPEYKDSGVEWLGKTPAQWEVSSIKRNYAVIGGATPKSDVGFYWDGDIDWVTPADLSQLQGFEITRSIRRLTEAGLHSCGTSMVPAGSIILSTRAPIGLLGIASVPLCTNQGCKALAPNLGQVPRFVAYALTVATSELNIRGKGTTFLELSGDELGRFQLSFPGHDEQFAIATFLDRETAKIDGLIAEQEKLLALLAEKRQATISHAVTRGLDPNAPMKDSGIPWLGEVPAHWEVIRLKFIASVQTGIAKGKDVSGKNTISVPYLRVANVQDGYLKLEDVAIIEVEPEKVERYRLRDSDVLMNEGGDFDKLGRGAIWNSEIENCIHQNHVFAVRPNGVRPAWLNQVTSAEFARFYFMGRSKQSTNLASISSTNIMELPVIFPPDGEQSSILDWVNVETNRFGHVEEEVSQALNLLKERRSALISAAVTGKIDVRGLMEESA